jgi:hypothetical protein
MLVLIYRKININCFVQGVGYNGKFGPVLM